MHYYVILLAIQKSQNTE